MGTNRILEQIGELIISLIISIATVVCALLLSVEVADQTKGRVFADVGIPMYTHAGRALILATLCYAIIIILVFVTVRFLWKSKVFIYIYIVVNFFFFFMVWFVFMALIA